MVKNFKQHTGAGGGVCGGADRGLSKWQLSEMSELEETSGYLVQQKRKRWPSRTTD